MFEVFDVRYIGVRSKTNQGPPRVSFLEGSATQTLLFKKGLEKCCFYEVKIRGLILSLVQAR